MSTTKARPNYADAYGLTILEADVLVAALSARGYLSQRKGAAVCSTTPEGDHVHYSAVVVTLTPDQARKLAGIKAAPKPTVPTDDEDGNT